MDIFGDVIGIATTDSLNEGSDYYTIATLPAPPPATKAGSKT
jgi:hypothetical protein